MHAALLNPALREKASAARHAPRTLVLPSVRRRSSTRADNFSAASNQVGVLLFPGQMIEKAVVVGARDDNACLTGEGESAQGRGRKHRFAYEHRTSQMARRAR
eukprot:Amastigsp_a191203_5.p2 type:complete len:103 gc:universal Amastigsp_a191203_5:117-425(+)